MAAEAQTDTNMFPILLLWIFFNWIKITKILGVFVHRPGKSNLQRCKDSAEENNCTKSVTDSNIRVSRRMFYKQMELLSCCPDAIWSGPIQTLPACQIDISNTQSLHILAFFRYWHSGYVRAARPASEAWTTWTSTNTWRSLVWFSVDKNSHYNFRRSH